MMKRMRLTLLLVFAVAICGYHWAADRNSSHGMELATSTNANLSDNSVTIEVEACVAEAFERLNEIRQNPSAYSAEIGVDLSDVVPRQPLRMDPYLTKAAQEKANSMAAQDYCDHVDPDGYGMNIRIHEAGYELPAEWCQPPSKNFFESISAGRSSGKEVIDDLIVDEGIPDFGHRKHLLGIDDFHAKCLDIGIGHAYNPNSQYGHYWSIIIAMHNF